MFETERIVEFGMCDGAGILFFARIFDLAHSGYEEFVLRGELDNNYFENDLYAIPLVSATADYHAPIGLHDVLKMSISVPKVGKSSFHLTINFIDELNNAKATVKTIHVFVDKNNFTKADIPDEFLQLLNKYRGEE